MKSHLYIAILAALVMSCGGNGEKVIVLPDNPNVAYNGRFDFSDSIKPVFMYSGCGIRTDFTGTSVELILKDDSLRNFFTIVLDDSVFVLNATEADSTYLLADSLQKGKHKLEIYRRSEWHGGNSTFLGLKLDPKAKVFAPAPRVHKIEFIGDSYTCGYGNEGLAQTEHFTYETENHYMSYDAITARELNADLTAVCRSGIGIVQGYGGNKGFNMPAFYDEVTLDTTKKWDYTTSQPEAVVIDLITNDLSVKLDSAEFINKYLDFLKRIRGNYPDAKIVCIAGPASPGDQWRTVQSYIHTIVNEFGKTDQNVNYFAFTPFEMHGSDWHPNVDEDKKMAAELVPYLNQLLSPKN
jgi:hypothetical protein